MNFGLDADQQLLGETTRRFLDQHHPLAALRPLLERPHVVDRDVWRRGAALGWTAMLVPQDLGGGSVTAQPLVDLVVLAGELGRVLYPGPVLPTNVVADAIARSGTDQQRKEHLPAIAAGERVAAWCASGDGTPDEEAVQVRATPEGEGWRLHGTARYVHGAAEADLLLVAMVVDGGLGHALVPRSADGISVRTVDGLDLTRRLDHVSFDSVAIAGVDRLGEGRATADGEVVLARAIALATVLQAAEITGAAAHLLETTVQYAKDRVQFGRSIGSFQALKHRLADLHIAVEAMRAATDYAALALGDGFDDAGDAVAVAGSYVADAHAHLCGEAVQLHGGIGFTWEHDVHLFVRRAKVDQVLYGEPAWHRERLCRSVEAAASVGSG